MTPVERVTRALERMEQVPRPVVWIHLREQEQALTDARVIEAAWRREKIFRSPA